MALRRLSGSSQESLRRLCRRLSADTLGNLSGNSPEALRKLSGDSQEALRKLSGDSQEALRKISGGSQEALRRLSEAISVPLPSGQPIEERGIWEASGSHPGGIWEASGRHLGGIWEASGRHLGLQAAMARRLQVTKSRCPSQLKCKSSITK